MKLITSAQNEQLKHLFRLLTQAKARRESGETVLEGVHLLQTYLQSGGTPKQVYLPEKKQQHPEIQEIAAQLDEGLITWVGNEALSKITSLTDADDVMTWIDIPQQAGLPSDGDCVVLERVQDPGNAGTILRSAAAAGVKQIVCGNDSVDIWSPKCCERGWVRIFCCLFSVEWNYPLGWKGIGIKFGQLPWAVAISVCMRWISVNLVLGCLATKVAA